MGKQKLNWKKYSENPYSEGKAFTLQSVESLRGRSSDEESKSQSQSRTSILRPSTFHPKSNYWEQNDNLNQISPEP